MSVELRERLLQRLTVLSFRYPDMRFGQLVAFACSLAGEHEPGRVEEVDDRQLLAAIDRHLVQKDPNGRGTVLTGVFNKVLTTTRSQLFDSIKQIGREFPEWSTGEVVARIAQLGHVNLYDAEDDELVKAARSNTPGMRWFASYMTSLEEKSTRKERQDHPTYRCPCCHYWTLYERGGFEICPVCYWEDDGQDDSDADTVRGGPNSHLSLTQARKNYLQIGACETRFLPHVRPPRAEEK